jgi:hypothetical protein
MATTAVLLAHPVDTAKLLCICLKSSIEAQAISSGFSGNRANKTALGAQGITG